MKKNSNFDLFICSGMMVVSLIFLICVFVHVDFGKDVYSNCFLVEYATYHIAFENIDHDMPAIPCSSSSENKEDARPKRAVLSDTYKIKIDVKVDTKIKKILHIAEHHTAKTQHTKSNRFHTRSIFGLVRTTNDKSYIGSFNKFS